MIRNRWLLILLVMLMLGSTLVSSSCKRAKPEGSVIGQSAEWVISETDGEFTLFRITATVMNIGADGVIRVVPTIYFIEENGIDNVEGRIKTGRVTSKVGVTGHSGKTINLYLKQGQEKTLNFSFWLSEGSITYRLEVFPPSD